MDNPAYKPRLRCIQCKKRKPIMFFLESKTSKHNGAHWVCDDCKAITNGIFIAYPSIPSRFPIKFLSKDELELRVKTISERIKKSMENDGWVDG